MLLAAGVEPSWYLVLASALFAIGATGLLVRRNPLVMFMCVELMLNAVTLTFVTFSRMLDDIGGQRSEEHTSELQSLMRISYAVFCLKKKTPAYKIIQLPPSTTRTSTTQR